MQMQTENEKVVFKGKLTIEEATIRSGDKKFTRQRLKREDAVAVLLLNTDTNKIILTQQFRYPLAGREEQDLPEIVAGKIDQGEEPLQTALRETEEEVGYRVQPENMRYLLSCYSSPGYTTEKFYIYYATVKNTDRLSEGGGLEEENEYIRTIETDLVDFMDMLRSAQIKDAKTWIAGLYLFQEWSQNPALSPH